MSRGVTLVEVLIVVAILSPHLAGGVAIYAIPKFQQAQKDTAKTDAKTLVQVVETLEASITRVPAQNVRRSKRSRPTAHSSRSDVNVPWGQPITSSAPVDLYGASSQPRPDGKDGPEDDVSGRREAHRACPMNRTAAASSRQRSRHPVRGSTGALRSAGRVGAPARHRPRHRRCGRRALRRVAERFRGAVSDARQRRRRRPSGQRSGRRRPTVRVAADAPPSRLPRVTRSRAPVKRQRRRGERGLTLVEVLIVMAIARSRSSAECRWRGPDPALAIEGERLEGRDAMRVAYQRCASRATYLRLVDRRGSVANLVEESSERILLQSKDLAGNGGADPPRPAKRSRPRTHAHLTQGPQAPRASFHALPGPAGRAAALQPGISCTPSTRHQDTPRTSGRAYVYSFGSQADARASARD